MPETIGHFEWNEQKALLNLEKHGVSFEEAALSFFDADFVRAEDRKHSLTEQRYSGIGKIQRTKMVVTIFTERGNNIRIISSRLANKKERDVYEKRKK